MDELLRRVRAALPVLVGVDQPRYKVTDVPDARCIRYYVSLGLVDQPVGRKGTFALYAPRHLLQVLAVKKLQAEYLPIRKIQALLSGLDDAALAQLLGAPVDLDALVSGEGSPAIAGDAPEARRAPAGRDPGVVRTEADAASATAAEWVRHAIGPGIELHLLHGRRIAPDELDSIVDTILEILSPKHDRRPRDRHPEE